MFSLLLFSFHFAPLRTTTRPVVGTAYAATIQDWSLCKKALKTEFISLFVCIAIGAAVGAGTG
jgi:hypothetical protein